MNYRDIIHRKSQFRQLGELSPKSDCAIRIVNLDKSTDWVFITHTELQAVIAVLTIE